MGYLELDPTLGREVTAMVKEVRCFVENNLIPAGRELDRETDPAAVYAADSPLWEVFRKYRQLELHIRDLPKEVGGLVGEVDPRTGPVVEEELGRGDPGLAVSMAASDLPFALAARAASPETRQWAEDYSRDSSAGMIGCWAVPDAGGGLERLMPGKNECGPPLPAPGVRAVRRPDHYLLQGETEGPVINAPLATHAAVAVMPEPSGDGVRCGLAVVPLDLAGVSVGTPPDRIGLRALPQGTIAFDRVALPESCLVVSDLAKAGPLFSSLLNRLGLIQSGAALGLARAAYEAALGYARQRVQGGVPLFEHKNIKLQLFTMFTRVETARAFLRRVDLYNRTGEAAPLTHLAAARRFCTRAAFETASDAIGVFGGNGLTKEYPVEKMFRDARVAMTGSGMSLSLFNAGKAAP